MINAFVDLMQRISIVVGRCTNNYSNFIFKLCCTYCIFCDAINYRLSLCAQWFSIRECCWRTKATSVKYLFFALRLIVYLLGLSLMISCLSITNSTDSVLHGTRIICISSIILYAFRIFIMFFMFFFCSIFNPNKSVKSNERHEGYLRLEEMGTSICSASSRCRTTDLTHILKCHDVLHEPVKDCNPCYVLTCREKFLIGFHQTTLEVALLIAENGFKCGKTGMFGGGIYFARSVDLTDRKALTNGAVICALVDMGKR